MKYLCSWKVIPQRNPKNTVSIAEKLKLQSVILLYDLHNYFVIQPKVAHKTSTKLDLIHMKRKSRLLLSTERKKSSQTKHMR